LYQRKTNNLDLEQVAEEFEALFVTQMLKQAYESKLSDGIFDSSENETYQSLLNQEMGRKLATNSNFGIADALKNQFKNIPK
jgi:flagellar protein FlgJ